MKRYIFGLMACICLSLVFSPAAYAETHLQIVSNVLADAYSNDEAKSMQQNISLFKEADLSYQESLATPFISIGDCKSQSELGVLMGMYQFDSSYALVFGKAAQFAQARRAMVTELKPRLDVMSTLDFTPVSPELVKDVAQNPGDAAKREELFKHFQGVTNQMIAQAGKDEAVLQFVADTAYGTVLQGLYVATSLASQAEMGPKLEELFADQDARIAKLEMVYNAMQNELLDRGLFNPDRFRTISSVDRILRDSNCKPDTNDITKMLDILTEARAAFVSECK